MNIFSEKVDINKQAEIKAFIIKTFGAIEKEKQYAFWELKHKDFTATFYNSSKFVIQGKDISKLLEKLGDEFNLPFTVASHKLPQEPEIISLPMPYIGTDESGKGDFFGPLVVAGVMIDEKSKKIFEDMGIKDSKKLKDDDMLKMLHEIQKNSIFSVVSISNAKYNELYIKFRNLNKLLAWGHARVIENILEKAPSCKYALSDKFGDESLIKNALMEKGGNVHLEQRVRAESDIAVAAASVLARATYVQRLEDMSGYYGFKFPKGCGENVKEAAKAFTRMYDKKRLYEVCKGHFKTYHELY